MTGDYTHQLLFVLGPVAITLVMAQDIVSHWWG